MIVLVLALYLAAVVVAVGSSAAGLVPVAIIACVAMAVLCFLKEIKSLGRRSKVG